MCLLLRRGGPLFGRHLHGHGLCRLQQHHRLLRAHPANRLYNGHPLRQAAARAQGPEVRRHQDRQDSDRAGRQPAALPRVGCPLRGGLLSVADPLCQRHARLYLSHLRHPGQLHRVPDPDCTRAAEAYIPARQRTDPPPADLFPAADGRRSPGHYERRAGPCADALLQCRPRELAGRPGRLPGRRETGRDHAALRADVPLCGGTFFLPARTRQGQQENLCRRAQLLHGLLHVRLRGADALHG